MRRSTISAIAYGTGGFSTLGSLRLLGVMPYRYQFQWAAVIDATVLLTFMACLFYLLVLNRGDK